jgi:hypothetical protein
MKNIVMYIIAGFLTIALIVIIVGLATNWFKGSKENMSWPDYIMGVGQGPIGRFGVYPSSPTPTSTSTPTPTPATWGPACQKEIDTCGNKCKQSSREDQMLAWCTEKRSPSSPGNCNQDSDCEKACTKLHEKSCEGVSYCEWNDNGCIVNSDMAKLRCKCVPNNASCSKQNYTSSCYFGDFPACVPGAGIECG